MFNVHYNSSPESKQLLHFRSQQRAMVADHTQWGYWIDGLCDLIGTVFFMLAVLYICQRSNPRKLINFHIRPCFCLFRKLTQQHSTDPDQEAFLPPRNTKSNYRGIILAFKQSTVIVASLSLLQFTSSYFWNRYMEQYHYLLEVPIATETSTGNAESFQLETMRSASFW